MSEASLIENVPAVKPSRRALYITTHHAEPGAKVFVQIGTDGKRWDDYWFERIPSEIGGVAVRVEKIWDGKTRDFATENYDVLVSQHSSCECLGFLRHGHCRHVLAARQLLAEGKLRLPPRPEHAPERP